MSGTAGRSKAWTFSLEKKKDDRQCVRTFSMPTLNFARTLLPFERPDIALFVSEFPLLAAPIACTFRMQINLETQE